MLNMSKIIENRRIGENFFLMRVDKPNEAKMGQFYMLRSWGRYPLLSRPLSVHDSDGGTLSFLYCVAGEGTELLSNLEPGNGISVGNALGNGFPFASGRIALVGGGAGIAPLYLAAKTLKCQKTTSAVDFYLGFSESPKSTKLEEKFGKAGDSVIVDIGGFITDKIDVEKYDTIFSCGPKIMMQVLQKKCAAAGTKHFVSLESRMACGIGICLGCTCITNGENKKICTDGPVFDASEVFCDAQCR